MSAFDRLQNYNSRQGLNSKADNNKNCPLDVTTPQGAFLKLVHNNGYKIYEIDDMNVDGTPSYKYTELYDVITTSGNQIINAIAGSGKTTATIFKIMHDIITGETMTYKSIPNGTKVKVVDGVWVCTYLRTGAEELEKSLTRWQSKLGYSPTSSQVSFSTLDAEFKRCLTAMGVDVKIGSPEQLNTLLRKAITSCNITRNGESLTSEDYQIISSILEYYRGRLDDRKYQHVNCRDYSLTPNILNLLNNQFASLRKTEGIMDFVEVQELLYQYLYVTPNKNVQDFVANRYKYIYIDEFQDTSQLQYAIIKAYARGKLWINRDGDEHLDNQLYTGEETDGKLVVIGDPSQCIYSFKGSDSNILVNEVDKDFRPCHSTLSTNWRCPSNILNPVVPSIHLNKDSESQKIVASKDGGIFKAYSLPTYSAMISQLDKDMQEDMEENNTVAILCRTNFDGVLPAFMLEALGKYNFSISGNNMTLNSPLAKKLLHVSSLFTERSSSTVRGVLDMFVGRGNKWCLKELMDTLKTNSLSIWTVSEDDLKYTCPDLVELVVSTKRLFFDENNKRVKENEISALSFVYQYLMTYVFNNKNLYCENARAYISIILYILENNNFRDIYEFIDYIDLIDSKLQGRIKKKNTKIRIATVHEFKGKECDSVYVWNDSDGVFPSNKCELTDEEQVAEERRVHYIACTRAKKKEHIYCLNGKVGKFVKEMDLIIENPIKPSVNLNDKRSN